jgi:primosomal protein N' (replication factor Y)
MLKIDIILPISLQPLTYLCPPELKDKAIIGMPVSVPLRNKTVYGVICDVNITDSKLTNLKEIISIIGNSPVLTKNHIELINWMSGYYHCEKGLILKSMIPDQILSAKIFPAKRKNKLKKITFEKSPISSDHPLGHKQLELFKEIVSNHRYKTILVHCDSFIHQLSIIIELLSDVKNAIILCPEIEQAEYAGAVIEKMLNRRVLIVHSGLSLVKRIRTYNEIIDGKDIIVCGTLSASLVPLKNPSLFIVIDEHSPNYKQERHPRFNARDIMVRRGFMEGIAVILLSVSPSCVSYMNYQVGKYDFCDMTKVTLVQNLVIENMSGVRTTIKKDVFNILDKTIKDSRHALIYINKKGYSILRCRDCESVIECPKCESPLMFFADTTLRCNNCGFTKKAIANCPVCKGVTFDNIGSGIQRIERLINQKMRIIPVRLDSSLTMKEYNTAVKEALINPIVIATRLALNDKAFFGFFDHIIYLNPDIHFTFADYLSNERLYQEVRTLCGMLKDSGKIHIQTRFPRNPIFTTLRKRDYPSFAINEINKRNELSYPPFSKMASLVFYYNGQTFPFEIPEKMDDVSILGPITVYFNRKGYSRSIKIILKSRDRNSLNQAIINMKKSAEESKICIDIEIDP